MTGMRILIVTRSLPDHGLGGMEAVAWDVAKGLSLRGHTVRVLTTQCPTLASRTTKDGISIFPLSTPSGRYSSAWWRESLAAFQKEFADNTDVVLSVSAGAMSIAKWATKNRPQIALLVQAHGTAWSEVVSKLKTGSVLDKIRALKNALSMWGDRGYRNFDGFIAIGSKVTHDISSRPTRWIVGNLPVCEIPNGIDTSIFRFDPTGRERIRKQFNLLPQHKAVLSASRLHPQKGISEGLAGFALAAQKDPDLRYLIVGSGAAEQSLRKTVDRLKIAEKVQFLGAVPRMEMPAHFSASDVFLFPTLRQEGLALNIMEALACGLPCIVSHHVNKEEFKTVGVDPFSPGEIADEILKMTAGVLSSSHHTLLPDSFSLDRTIEKYEDHMERAACDFGSKNYR